MIGADSNLIVRYLTGDDPVQAGKVRRLFENSDARQEPVFISQIVACEVTWVLATSYGLERNAIGLAIESLLADGSFVWQDRTLIEDALASFKRLPGQFADHLLGAVARSEKCRTTYTFDRSLPKSPNFTLLK